MSKTLLIGAAAVAFAAGGVYGDVIIGNFSADPGVGTAFGDNTFTEYKAFGFTMGAEPYFLDWATLSMNIENPNPQMLVEIWSGTGLPQAHLLTLDNPTFGLGPGVYDFMAPTQFVLDAGETYWLRVQSDPPTVGPRFQWDGTDPSTMPSGPYATAVGFVFNDSPSGFYNRLEIHGTLVPTPGALAMLGMAGLLARRRR